MEHIGLTAAASCISVPQYDSKKREEAIMTWNTLFGCSAGLAFLLK